MNGVLLLIAVILVSGSSQALECYTCESNKDRGPRYCITDIPNTVQAVKCDSGVTSCYEEYLGREDNDGMRLQTKQFERRCKREADDCELDKIVDKNGKRFIQYASCCTEDRCNTNAVRDIE